MRSCPGTHSLSLPVTRPRVRKGTCAHSGVPGTSQRSAVKLLHRGRPQAGRAGVVAKVLQVHSRVDGWGPFWPTVSYQSQKGKNQPQANITPRRFSPEEQGLQVVVKSGQDELSQPQGGTLFLEPSQCSAKGSCPFLHDQCPRKQPGFLWLAPQSLQLPVLACCFQIKQSACCVCVSRPRTSKRPSDELAFAWQRHCRLL